MLSLIFRATLGTHPCVFMRLCVEGNNADRLHAVTPLSLDRLPPETGVRGPGGDTGQRVRNSRGLSFLKLTKQHSLEKKERKIFPENGPPCRGEKTHSKRKKQKTLQHGYVLNIFHTPCVD